MMAFKKGENPNRPKKGAAIKVDPIRDKAAIELIKTNLLSRNEYRNYCLFTLGINTAWRANELLSLTIGHVKDIQAGDSLELKMSKTGRYRQTPLNHNAVAAIHLWLEHYPKAKRHNRALFLGKGTRPLGVPAFCNLVKHWCDEVGLSGRYGSHSLRKTWGYQQRTAFNTPLTLIMQALGHSSERQTMNYIGIQPPEIDGLYGMEL